MLCVNPPSGVSRPGARPGGPDVVVASTGAVTPVGADADQTFTSVRAGIRRMLEQPDLYACLPEDPRFEDSEPLVASAVYHLDPAARAAGRMAEWLGTLAGEAFRDLARRGRLEPRDLDRLGLFLAAPARPGLGPEQRDELLRHFQHHAGLAPLAAAHVQLGGHATALELLERACELMRKGTIARAAVGGVDSYLHRPWLERLDREWRLLSTRNPDGLQPGEAAGFVLLEHAGAAEARGLAPLAAVRAHGSCRVAPGQPQTTGAELSRLLEPLLPAEPPLVYCDLNGESARTREWAFAVSRLGRCLPDGYAVEHPASALGDTGAASAAMSLVLAAHALHAGDAGRRSAVIWAAAEDGERRAAVLERV